MHIKYTRLDLYTYPCFELLNYPVIHLHHQSLLITIKTIRLCIVTYSQDTDWA